MENSKNKEVVIVAPTTVQPRYHKRALQIQKNKIDVTVFAFSRAFYNNNKFPDQIPFNSLGYLTNGNYLKRIIPLFKAIKSIRAFRKERTKKVHYYCFTFDSLVIAKLAGLKTGVYEVGDLRVADKKNGIFSLIERILLKWSSIIVLTSPCFYNGYYQKYNVLSKEKIFIIENKLNKYFRKRRTIKRKSFSNRIRIGLIGYLRYEKPINYLINFVKRNKDYYELICYGDGPSSSTRDG